MRHLLFLLVLMLPSAAFAAEKLRVVVSFNVLADIVKEVGGERIEITTLVPHGTSAHDFQPKPEDIKKLQNADLIIVNGLGYESWIGRMVVAAGYSGTLLAAGRDVPSLSIDGDTTLDPHAWLSLAAAQQYALSIRDALSTADRFNAQKFSENAARFAIALGELDSWIRTQLVSIPQEYRVAVVPHPAFQYFGKHYGVRFLSPAANASAADIARLEDRMLKDQIRAVFNEYMGDNRTIAQLLQDTRVNASGTLYVESLSPSPGAAENYLALMRHNATRLIEGMRQNGPLSAAATSTLRIPDDATMISIP